MRAERPRIFWAGDSTVAYNGGSTYPQCGLGQGIRPFLRREIDLENHAVNGRSTKSFLDEGRLAPVYDRMTAGDFLLIQFGHNDEKETDPARYTEPFGEYRENLCKFIAAARNKKARPLLVTPLCRRWLQQDGSPDPGAHREYRLAVLQTAREQHASCLDLCEASRRLLAHTPPEVSARWFMNLPKGEFSNYPDGLTDNTHLRRTGALVFGELFARGLNAMGGVYRDLLDRPEKRNDTFDGEIILE